MIVKYIRPSIFSRVSVLAVGHSILVRTPNGEVYVFDNPENPAPHQKTEAIGINSKYPITPQSIFEDVDKITGLAR